MAKGPQKTGKAPALTTRKKLAGLEKERMQRKILVYVCFGVLALIVGVLLFGVLDKTVLQANRTVSKIGDDRISVKEFQSQVRFRRYQLVQNFLMFSENPMFAQYFASQLKNAQDALDDYVSYGDQVLTVMEEDVIIAQQAKLMGISVSDEELNKAMEGFFQYYPEGTPTPTEEVTREPIPTSTLSPTQKALSQRPTEIPTEEPTLSPTLEVTETAEPTATTVAATQPPAETPAATSTPYPTATPYTQEGFETAQKNYYQTLSELKVTEADVRATLKAQLLREKVYDEVTKDVGYLQPMVWARHILVESEEEAKAVLDRLKAGENWFTLAAELSTDTSNSDNGGDLGWFTRDDMVKEFSDSAFTLPIGEISDPVQTSFGYHIIQVLGHEDREVNASQLETIKDSTFSQWVDMKKLISPIKRYDLWSDVVPSTPTIPDANRL